MMKNDKFTKTVLFFCIIALSLEVISLALSAGKPSQTYSSSPGYVMFNDDLKYVIRSDGINGRVYADCSKDGTDQVEISIWDDGTFQGLHFFPGVMKEPFYNCTGNFSSRRVNFHFNVSGIPTSQLQPAGAQSGNAVREILRWYKGTNGYLYRTDASGFIYDDSLHVPMDLYRTGHAWIQFAIDPTPDISNLKAVTQGSVNSFYESGDTNTTYWCTDKEPALYVIYTIEYGRNGVDVQPVPGRPNTWIIKTKSRKSNDPVRLYVTKDNESGQAVYLANYASVPFELAVSLNPFTTGYPSASLAPPKNNTISTTWGELKEE